MSNSYNSRAAARGGALVMVTTTAVLWGPMLAGARAESNRDAGDEATTMSARTSEAVSHVLPDAMAAETGRASAVALAWGGYDDGMHAPVAVFRSEIRLMSRLVLMAGAGYSVPNALGQGGGSFRPEIGGRVQILDQGESYLNLSAGLLFREDRFGAEDGMFQGIVAASRRVGRTSVLVNVVYSQDGEGDDHEGEARLAVIRDLGAHLHLGLDGRGSHSLASTDPKRTIVGTPVGQAFAGPLAAVTFGPIALLAEAGLDSVWTTRRQTGLLTAAGLAAMF